MNHKKIQRIMRKYRLCAKVRRKNPYKRMMQKNRKHRVAPNILQRKFLQPTPYTVFCTDITYLPFQDGFAYLSVIKDVASGEAVAWHTSSGLEVELVTATLEAMRDLPSEDALMHSDQGFHYTSPRFTGEVRKMGMIQSMSRKGTCIDNAPIESFFGHMKDELDYRDCRTLEQLRVRIDAYMRYYNYERKQWGRNKMSPVDYREHLFAHG